ncbi:hypothetical protein J2801_005441 [Paraburkholderia phenoliruptrix]|nr:hypothetical protein [Paraburkholderia phenoliruptrix]
MNHLLVFAAYLFTSNYFMVSVLMLTNTYHRMLNANKPGVTLRKPIPELADLLPSRWWFIRRPVDVTMKD